MNTKNRCSDGVFIYYRLRPVATGSV